MVTKADLDATVGKLTARMEGLTTKGFILQRLLITQISIYLGIISVYFTS
ncbi:MAG: hypothetical protein O3C70_00735 [Actinomycetota bacterium]|nr:hypothetical protein [Actinomycetota bacterium]